MIFWSVLFINAVGQGRGGGLVDDALDIQAGDLAGVLGGLALGVGEVGRDGDDRLGDACRPDRPPRPAFSFCRIMAEISCGV